MAEQTQITQSDIIKQAMEDIKQIVKTSFTDEKNLWTAERIGAYLGIAPSTVLMNYACLPNFPRSYKFSSAKNSTRRWKALEVKEWAEKYKEQPKKGVHNVA